MTPPSLESATVSLTSIRHRASDAVRQAHNVAEEVRLLQHIAADALDDAREVAHISMQSLRDVRAQVAALRDEIAHRVRERPMTALAISFGIGLSIGVLYAQSQPRRDARA